LSLFSAVFPMIIQYFLWTNIFKEHEYVYGYTYGQMIAYSILAGIITKVLATGFEWEIAADIKSGTLDRFIVKPISYAYYRVSCFLGKKFVQMIVLIFITGLVILGLNTFIQANIQLSRIPLFTVTIVLSICINFLLFFIMSIMAFWITHL